VTLSHYDLGIPLEGLREDARRAVAGWDWNRGAFGHALSLPASRDLHPYARHRYHNHPCAGLLGRCPHLRAVFEMLLCEKISFRLLRREPASAYAWHTDQWKGPGVVRFQIPIVSDADAFLVTTDYTHEDQVRGVGRVLSADTFATFAEANAGHFARHTLEPGLLHYFDTTRVHTLVNPGPGQRLTLSFDLVANDWLRARYPAIRAEVGEGPLAALPRPGSIDQAGAWALSQLHPLRTRIRRWRHRRHTGPAS
jgi:hypothetical protein